MLSMIYKGNNMSSWFEKSCCSIFDARNTNKKDVLFQNEISYNLLREPVLIRRFACNIGDSLITVTRHRLTPARKSYINKKTMCTVEFC